MPLIVRNVAAEEYEVVTGASRFRAAQAAELFSVPVRVVELSDSEALTLQLVENAQREDVHPLEEAYAYRALLNMAEPKYDVASIALKVWKSAGYVYGRLRFVDLIEDAAKAFLENRLTAGHALLIARLPQTQQSQALDAAFRSHWGSTEKQVVPVRELAQWIRQQLMPQLDDAIFDREDETLIPEAGSCVQWPKRTGFNTALFDDFQDDDRCMLCGISFRCPSRFEWNQTVSYRAYLSACRMAGASLWFFSAAEMFTNTDALSCRGVGPAGVGVSHNFASRAS